MQIGIIGAGASGMAAAIAAAENPNVNVVLLERQTRVGKKLLATGNGRCNLSNRNACAEHYHGQDASFCQYALQAYSVEDTLAWFRSLGLFTVTESSGRVYPYSDHANSVVDILRFALERPNITLRTGFEVIKVQKAEHGFYVRSADEKLHFDRLIIACGGFAGTRLGGSMLGYKLFGQLGHRSTRLRPALVQLKSSWSGVSALKGVRANCYVQICCDGATVCSSTGELQFTDYGLSGPVIFEVSRDACSTDGQWTAQLDFLPEYTHQTLLDELLARAARGVAAQELLTGILHNRLGKVLLKASGVQGDACSAAQLEDVCNAVKSFEVTLTEPMGMDSAQVTAGGVLTGDFDQMTMESKCVPGLFACGEVLDIDGDCGGYNLQWAWSSGRLAGYHAGKEIE